MRQPRQLDPGSSHVLSNQSLSGRDTVVLRAGDTRIHKVQLGRGPDIILSNESFSEARRIVDGALSLTPSGEALRVRITKEHPQQPALREWLRGLHEAPPERGRTEPRRLKVTEMGAKVLLGENGSGLVPLSQQLQAIERRLAEGGKTVIEIREAAVVRKVYEDLTQLKRRYGALVEVRTSGPSQEQVKQAFQELRQRPRIPDGPLPRTRGAETVVLGGQDVPLPVLTRQLLEVARRLSENQPVTLHITSRRVAEKTAAAIQTLKRHFGGALSVSESASEAASPATRRPAGAAPAPQTEEPAYNGGWRQALASARTALSRVRSLAGPLLTRIFPSAE